MILVKMYFIYNEKLQKQVTKEDINKKWYSLKCLKVCILKTIKRR